ncbi:MATE family efflux transporter [soil metagenome]
MRRLALPAILSSVLQTLVFLVDRAILGHAGKGALSAMQIAGPLELSIFSIFLAFEVGTIAHVGRLVGAGEHVRARRAAAVALALAFAIGVVVAFMSPLLLLLAPYLASSASHSTVTAAQSYLVVTLASSPVVFLGAGSVAVLQASGDTRTPLVVGAIANVVHVIIVSYLVLGIFGGPHLGMRGCAWGTVATFVIEAGLAFYLLTRRGRILAAPAKSVAAEPVVPFRDELRAIVRVGWPAMAERVLYHAGFNGYVAMIGTLGDGAMAANQALISIEAICFLSADGFGVAAASIVARKLGAGEGEQAKRAARIAARDAAITLTFLGLGALLGQSLIYPIFGDDPTVATLAATAMPVLAFAQPFMGTSIVLAQAVRGAGRTGVVMGISALGAVVVRLTATWYFAIERGGGLRGIWLGSTCDWIVRSALLVLAAGTAIGGAKLGVEETSTIRR